MQNDFLPRYLEAFGRIPGWFSPDACLMFMAYHQLLAEHGLAGDTLEIGVHHGLSAIGVAALRGEGRRFVAVDLFEELQGENVSRSGFGNRQRFEANMRRFYDDLSFLTTIAAPSNTLRPDELGREFSFCHIDGGHSMQEAYCDLELAAAISRPGGLIALDDYFNPAFPGVGEAAVRFSFLHGQDLRPIAIGFNKALFQREPAPFDLEARFRERFPGVRASTATLWGVRVPVFDAAFGAFFDLEASSPHRLAAAPGTMLGARLEPAPAGVTGYTGEAVVVPVHVTNLSRMPLSSGTSPFALSYHLWTSADQRLLRFDNPRTWFTEPLMPGAARIVDVSVAVPDAPGVYEVEFDVVWEGVLWMKDHGNPTARVTLAAVDAATPAAEEPLERA
jgi:predicted O-methyltransferase YrrM